MTQLLLDAFRKDTEDDGEIINAIQWGNRNAHMTQTWNRLRVTTRNGGLNGYRFFKNGLRFAMG